MTNEQDEQSAQLPAINVPSAESIEPFDDEQYAPLDSPTMSNHGLFTSYLASEHRLSGDWLVQPDPDEVEAVEEEEVEEVVEEEDVVEEEMVVVEDDDDDEKEEDEDEEGHRGTSDQPPVLAEPAIEQTSLHRQQTPPAPPSAPSATVCSRASQTVPQVSNDSERPRKRARISFYDFAAQAQLQQHHERRKHHLAARKRVLQRSIALAARLKRASSWVQDGLVEISKHQDSVGFVRVFTHANDLVDACYSHWNNELQNLDILHDANNDSPPSSTTPAFFDQLPSQAQSDLLNLLSDLRSNPRFLIDRLSNLPFSQVATLTAKPKWEASEALLASLSQQSGGSAQRRRRVQAFSKELEDYAMSFERSDPFSLMLHNIYSHDSLPDSPENQLRLWTWSSVCAELLQSQSESYGSLYWQALEAFSDMQEWPAKTRVELFLMDILQRGAFLIKEGTSQRGKSSTDHLNTRQAHEFFESAASDLYWTLIQCHTGCYPTGALSLAQAILGKLPDENYQSSFRTHFFQNWFLNHFLKTAIMYPENENMLLKIHVSRRARECVLAPLFNRFANKFETFMDPDADENIQNIILSMISMLEGIETTNPYANTTTTTTTTTEATESSLQPTGPPILVICASECVKILETLSPQAMYSAHYMSDGVMRGIGHAFQATYSVPSTRFDMLKQALLQLIEPGTSAKDVHPCLEAWTEFRVDRHGKVVRPEALVEEKCLEDLQRDTRLLVSQRAALRLCVGSSGKQTGVGTAVVSTWTPSSTLAEIFESQAAHSQAATDMVDFVFWKRAIADLRAHNPLMPARDDSILLRQPLRLLQATKEADMTCCDALEAQLAPFERTYKSFKRHIKDFVASLEGLRLKLWYTSEVVNSQRYIDARNVALALSHMNILHLRMTTGNDPPSRSYIRPTSSRSTGASIFGNLRDDAMEILKAPTEHGGPRKLADPQIESIKQWFQQHNVDNFCKGEERLHRFCMEIWQVSRTLTGETMMDSEELWASDLFARERASYDISAFGVNSAPASTRPASVISDTFSTSAAFHPLRPGLRSVDSDARSTTSDERSSIRRGSVYGLFQGRLNPQLLTPSLASSIGSYGRASSATTTASDIFSLPSQSVVTSASVYSRPPSILHGSLPNFAPRPAASTRDKKRFRDKLRTGLVCLLLSDLGSLVWSWGCETDTWIQGVQAAETVMARLDKRLGIESLRQHKDNGPARMIRRQSETEACGGTLSELNETSHVLQGQQTDSEPVDYVEALRDTLIRMSQQIDPVGKLQACVDFDSLALEQLSMSDETVSPSTTKAPPQHRGTRRRNSDTPLADQSMDSLARAATRLSLGDHTEATEKRTIHHYKRQLARLRPETIFRDLQYIAVFTPQEMLDKTPAGKAFMRLGVAALEYKKDLCSSMVDIANQIVAADGIKRRRSTSKPELSLSKAAEYWKIAALEGNREAQRELALLYLMHPNILTVVTSPLTTSSTIFQDDMMWRKQVGNHTSRQALCLALHWMQQAARAGDSIAQQKLQEREGELSIR